MSKGVTKVTANVTLVHLKKRGFAYKIELEAGRRKAWKN